MTDKEDVKEIIETLSDEEVEILTDSLSEIAEERNIPEEEFSDMLEEKSVIELMKKTNLTYQNVVSSPETSNKPSVDKLSP